MGIQSIDLDQDCNSAWLDHTLPDGANGISAISMCSTDKGIATGSTLGSNGVPRVMGASGSQILFYDSSSMSWSAQTDWAVNYHPNNIAGIWNVLDVYCFNGSFYAATAQNIYYYDEPNNTWEYLISNQGVNGVPTGSSIQVWVQDNSIWTISGGELWYSENRTSASDWTQVCDNPTQQPFTAFSEISFGPNGEILASTPGGLWIGTSSNDNVGESTFTFCKTAPIVSLSAIITAQMIDSENLIVLHEGLGPSHDPNNLASGSLVHYKLSCPNCETNCSEINCEVDACVIRTGVEYFNITESNGIVTIVGLDNNNTACGFMLDYKINCETCPLELSLIHI